MVEHRIIVIGASSGGVEALRELFQGLKHDLNAAIFVVLHIPPYAKSQLPEILSKRSTMPVSHAQDRETIEAGRAFIAPPDQHLIIQNGVMRLNYGPKVNHTRPAIDPLFESAAKHYGPSVIGVILSGNLFDGSKGLLSIKQAGGVVIVQDPEEALFTSMPSSALTYAQVDHSLPAAKIASLLNRLVDEAALEKGEVQVPNTYPDPVEDETNVIKTEFLAYENGHEPSQPSVLTCPDCGGVLWEFKDGKLLRYRCHTGHVYNPEILLSSRDNDLEKAFWTAIRVLVEKAALSNRLAIIAKDNKNKEMEAHYRTAAMEAEKQAKLIRETLFNGRAIGSRDISAGEHANDVVSRSL